MARRDWTQHGRESASRFAARVPAVAALAIALGAAFLLGRVSAREVADLKPRPDALEYEEAARSLLRGDGHRLRIDGRLFPSRYPPAMSWAIAGAMQATGTAPGSGAVVSLAAALASIVAAWSIAGTAGGPSAAAVAAFVVALSPLHVRWSRAVMADVPSAAACALVGAWALGALRRRSTRTEAFLLGLASGALASMRSSNVVLLPPLLLACLLDPETRRDFPRLVSLCAGIALGLALLLVDQWWRFGSPFADGYAFWVNERFHARSMSAANYFGRSRFPGPDGPPNLPHYLAVLAGDGTLWAWPVGILLAGGLAVSIRSRDEAMLRLGRFTAAFLVSVLAFFGAYYWQDDRFLLPVTSFAAAVAGLPLGVDRPRWARPTGLALLAVAVALSLGPYGVELRAKRVHGRSSVFRMLAAVDRVAPRDAVVFAPGDPFVVDRVLRMPAHDRSGAATSDRRFVALGRNRFLRETRPPDRREILPQRRLASKGWMLGQIVAPANRAATAARIARALDAGRPVVLAEPSGTRAWTGWAGGRPAPELAGFDFRIVARPPGFLVYEVSRGRKGLDATRSGSGPASS